MFWAQEKVADFKRYLEQNRLILTNRLFYYPIKEGMVMNMGDNGLKCHSCDGPGGPPLEDIPDAYILMEKPAPCERCVRIYDPWILAEKISRGIPGVVFRRQRAAIAAAIIAQRASLGL